MCATCVSTVLGERCSCAAMRRFVCPARDQADDLALAIGQRLDAALGRAPRAALAGDAPAEPAQLERGLVVQAARLRVLRARP